MDALREAWGVVVIVWHVLGVVFALACVVFGVMVVLVGAVVIADLRADRRSAYRGLAIAEGTELVDVGQDQAGEDDQSTGSTGPTGSAEGTTGGELVEVR